ncbi:MAG: hypothetical protein SPI65_06780 [Peptoniphilus sp.]|nr:HAD family hydrolase [Peptoniphilus sp.]MDD7363311.1 hypothetical protein [Bacillota bacterium]MDY6045259.1 hypothetical protein [Peptoniphilus sp.]
MTQDRKNIELVVFDTAGTVCDGPRDLSARWPEDDGKGCKAPVVPFYELFKNHGIRCDWETIRRPMGTYKPTHLRMLLKTPSIETQWVENFGRTPNDEDFDELLDEFRALLTKYIVDEDLARPVEGAEEAFRRLREGGALIGLDTGYFAKDAGELNAILRERYDLKADVESNGEDAPGRPTPFMIYDCMQKAYEITHKTFSCKQVVKVDDTAAGILSGNNAGAWTIGVYASGSNDYDELAAANPDFLVPDIRYVPELIFTQISAKNEEA